MRLAVASALGLGLSPALPGACAALLGLARHAALAATLPDLAVRAALLGALAATCIPNGCCTPWAVRKWRYPDPPQLVLDEVADYLVAALLLPVSAVWPSAPIAHVLFRVSDML